LVKYSIKIYCVLVKISWLEGLRIARLHDPKMERSTIVFFITGQNWFKFWSVWDMNIYFYS
jgi:hypothetical protein